MDFRHVKAQKAAGVPSFVLLNVEDFTVHGSPVLADTHIDKVDKKEM